LEEWHPAGLISWLGNFDLIMKNIIIDNQGLQDCQQTISEQDISEKNYQL
jgi:hypothetical protein